VLEWAYQIEVESEFLHGFRPAETVAYIEVKPLMAFAQGAKEKDQDLSFFRRSVFCARGRATCSLLLYSLEALSAGGRSDPSPKEDQPKGA